MISINKRTMDVVHEIINDAEALGCKVIKAECGATVIDMGLNHPGGWKAAKLFTLATLGNLAEVELGKFKLNDDYTFSSVEVYVDKPLIACMGSQIAGWKLGEGEFATIGSGPARALAVVESDHYFEMTPYRDDHHEAVLCIQDIKYPSEELILEVANACRVKPEDTYILIADSTCIVSSMQVSARIIEQVCHKMFEKDFDASQIVLARGSAPIAPVVKDETKTMGRINDALIYGSELEVWVDSTDELIENTIKQLTSKHSSPNYGELFEDIFVDAGRDFYYIAQDVHSVAKIQIHNINSGKSFVAGEVNYEILEKSFLN